MAGLKTIKQKIRATARTRQVTKAMEAVSAAKMRKAQVVALAARPYAQAAVSVLARVSGSKAAQSMPFSTALRAARPSLTVEPGHALRTLYLVITSDKGLAGALNTAVLRRVASEIKKGDLVIAIGRKARNFFTARGYTVEAYHPNDEELTEELLERMVRESTDRFVAGGVGRVAVAYQNFISTFEQRPAVRTLYPLSLEELAAVVSALPHKGEAAVAELSSANYTIEPSEEEVLSVIIPKLASVFLYHALLESQASEHSARMVAMKSASDKASEMTASLTLSFNKARQAAITREVSEIIGGMEALA